jgi:hypothetical protein
MSWLRAGWRPLDLTLQASAPLTIFAPSAYAYLVEGTKHVVFQGSNEDFEGDTQIHELWCATGDAWNHVNLTTSVDNGAPPASFSPSGYAFEEEQTQHAIYAGNTLSAGDQGKIYEIYWGTDDTKKSNNLTTAGGFGPSVDSPMGYDFGGIQYIVFRTTDSHVWVAWRNAASSDYTPSWIAYDLNKRYNVPALAVEAPTAFAQLDPVNNYTFVHILYYSADGQIHRFHGSEGAWTPENVSQNAGPAPLAADRPSGFCYQGETLFITYRSNDSHINILRSPNPFTESTWLPGTLTGTGGTLSGTGGAPLATPGTIPTGYVFPYDNTLHVDYADNAGNVHEIWSGDSWEWNWNPLTQNYGGSPAISTLSAYTFAKDNTQHIVYTGEDHHIWELQWSRGIIYVPPGGGIFRPFEKK